MVLALGKSLCKAYLGINPSPMLVHPTSEECARALWGFAWRFGSPEPWEVCRLDV